MVVSWKVSAIVAILFAVGCLGYNEDPCLSDGGNCQFDGNSCSGHYVDGKCPTQSSGIRCCMPEYYNEDPCKSNGGSCQPDTLTCSGGSYVSGQCPTQGGNIRCCQPSSPSGPLTCPGIGGNCQNFATCNGISVSRLCPGSSAQRCCVNPPGTDLIDQHLNQMEGGLYLIGYIPTAGSGVTIATGVDLGQQSNSGLQTLGVSASIRNKLSPYLGLKTRDQVHSAGLDENDLQLNLNEGVDLDHAFKTDLLRRIKRYDSNLTVRGQAVLASLTHWCYAAIRTSPDGKCYISGCPNYLKDYMGNGLGMDADLKAALVSLKECAIRQGRPSWVSQRHQGEIDFLP